jgi:hypothetical protein
MQTGLAPTAGLRSSVRSEPEQRSIAARAILRRDARRQSEPQAQREGRPAKRASLVLAPAGGRPKLAETMF